MENKSPHILEELQGRSSAHRRILIGTMLYTELIPFILHIGIQGVRLFIK